MFWLVIVFILVLTFNLYVKPLERIPSEIFSYVWSAVLIIKLIDVVFILFIKRTLKLFKMIDPLLIGVLIGTIIWSVKWAPINVALIRDLVFAISPLFLFIPERDL